MTNTETLVLDFLRRYEAAHGYPPTLQDIVEMAPTLNHRSSALYVMKKLEGLGLVHIRMPSGFRRRWSCKEINYVEMP